MNRPLGITGHVSCQTTTAGTANNFLLPPLPMVDQVLADAVVCYSCDIRIYQAKLNFYPNVTTLRSGICYRKSVCL